MLIRSWSACHVIERRLEVVDPCIIRNAFLIPENEVSAILSIPLIMLDVVKLTYSKPSFVLKAPKWPYLAKFGFVIEKKIHPAAITAHKKCHSQTSFSWSQLISTLKGLKHISTSQGTFPSLKIQWCLLKFLGSSITANPQRLPLRHLLWKAAFLLAITLARGIVSFKICASMNPACTIVSKNKVVIGTYSSLIHNVEFDFNVSQSISTARHF